MIKAHIISHGLVYAALATGYLFLLMIAFSPRVWGYHDYPEAVKQKVPVQTKKEKTMAVIVSLPWLFFVMGFPVFSTFALKAKLGGTIPFTTAFLNVLVMLVLVTIGDLVLLDWLVVSRITPNFVIIPGTVKTDYRDFSQHFIGHAKAAIPLTVLALVIAAIASF